ncbi:MAG: ABC transporter permease [Chthonomonadales bacterium]
MNILESFRVSLRGLSSNKMRTMLTMLGIIIGVAVVILVVAIGQGAAQRVTETVNALGTNLLTIFPGAARIRITAASNASTTGGPATSTGGTRGNSGASNRMTLEEAKLIAKLFPKSVDAVSPQVRGNVQIKLGNKDSSSNLTGASVDYPYVNNVEVNRGRFFTDTEVDGNMKVCVVGTTIADKLLNDPTADLTGKTISVNRQNFLVVGMLTPKGSGAFGQDQDDLILAPITTAMRRIFNQRYLSFISIRCTSPKMMSLAEEQISGFLRNRHHVPPPYPDNDDFNVRSQTDLMERQQSVTNTMTQLLSLVAVISLFVGGIGIMNIMLVSVTERTREIGIRKAIGATPRDILLQFLIESAIISLIGGIIGLIVGIGGAWILAKVAGWATIVDMTAVVAALVVSAGVGIFFGIYPASKAAALHPIEALRFE